jgi:chromosome segregation ATPase
MGAVTQAAWERFYNRVVEQGSDWPRNLWFAAVEDGLSAALPANSRLLAQYRQDVAELRELERAATGSHRDGQRIAQLEAEIVRLIGVADQSIRQADALPGEVLEAAPQPAAPSRQGSGLWLGTAVVAVVMSCGALLGATYYHQERMTARMEREFATLQQRLVEQAADQRAALEVRIKSADRVKENLSALHAQLRANVEQFNQVMAQSVRSMSALGDSTITDLERRLLDRNGELGKTLDALSARAATVERGLDQVDDSLALLTQRLPDLDSGMNRLSERLEATTAGFERVEGQVATIQAQAPEVALWLEGQRHALAQDLDARRRSVHEVDAELAALHGALDDSRAELTAFAGSLEQDLALAKQRGDALELALEDVRARDAEATALVAQVDAKVATTQDILQERIDEILSDLAERADLAVLRSEDVMKRAEGEAARRLGAATEQAIAGLGEAHEAQLAELRKWAAATQIELAQTRAGLIAGWRGMDEAVAERQSEVLADLDQYAATLEGRVQEFLEALDVIVARSDG